MTVELKVPSVGESITEVQVGEWLKGEGESTKQDEPVVVLESDKASLDLPAPVSGVLSRVLKKTGETARVGEVLAYIETDGDSKEAPAQKSAPASKHPPPPAPESRKPAPAKAAPEPKPAAEAKPPPKAEPAPAPQPKPSPPAEASRAGGAREEQVVPMSLLRKKIAERLVAAHQNAALLTTFNEIDMTAVQAVRKEHQEAFTEKHGVKLGLMSFFVKAAIEALKLVPEVNAEIRGTDIVFRNYHDIGIAVGSGKGLVVPVLRDANAMSFAEIEKAIGDFGARAKEGKLKVEELQGGTFTISNGGVYGSLLSTPIVNPPQSGILGLHAIQDRPVARDGQVVIRPMMYVALTYDHRLIDGREAVTFLKRVKECVESPLRMLVES